MPKPTLIEWLQERYENCLRHARQKPGWDRDGWLEDAAYFKEALNRLNSGNPNYTPVPNRRIEMSLERRW
jgi:hypothetical protein